MLQRVAAWFVVLVCLSPATALAQGPASVLVVANAAVPDSVRIAEHYAARRAIPADHILRLTTLQTEQIDRATFERTIQVPVANWVVANSAHDRILYIVLTRGIPLRIQGTVGRQGTVASVDSELALLYRRLTGVTVPVNGPVPNPFYLGDDENHPPARAFSRADYDIYLVTRLDGYSTDDVLALIDRGAAPAKGGIFVLDAPSDVADPRNDRLARAAERLKALDTGHDVVHDATSRLLQGQQGVIGYFSWGSNDPAMRRRAPDVEFAPGAIAGMFLSSDARTFTRPPDAWLPGQTGMQANFAGSRQSLIGDLVRAGVTGVSGAVAEPFLDGAIRPDLLFTAYAAGATLAEAYYLALPHVGWQMVVVGDPLCAPFRATSGADAPPPTLDPDTELPVYFSARRLAALVKSLKAPEAAVKGLLRAESRVARDDRPGAIDALKEAVAVDEGFIAGWRRLGMELDAARRFPEAIEAYRKVVDLDRNDIVALNNLAYGLSVHQRQLEEALGYATRAATLAKGNHVINDTLGWIHHLMGNHDEALRLIAPASRALPGNAEIQFHAAAVFAAVGRLEDARRTLDAAVKLDPAVRERPEFAELQRTLDRKPPAF